MKTGRLLKFHRPGGEIQAYLYREAGLFHASVFVLGPGQARDVPTETLTGPSEAGVERDLRAWVDRHFPEDTRR